MKRLTIAMLMAGSVVLAPSTASAHRGPSTFDGTCDLSGAVRQSPPLGVLPVEGTAVAHARGRCSGTLTNADGSAHQVRRARAYYRATASGSLSCGGGSSDGRGYLQIGRHRINFAFNEIRGPGVGAITLEGRAGGAAAGAATVRTDTDPLAIVERCAASRLRAAPIDLTLATAPSISG